jgi:AcrR family transcriptional regulator
MDPKELREQTIKDTKSQLILNAARKVFSEKGYWDARLEDIAASVGFSKASLYNYYPDKEAIFLSLAIRDFSSVLEALEKAAQEDKPIIPAIESLLRIVFKHYQENFEIMVNISNFRNLMTLHQDMAKHSDLFKEFHGLLERSVSPMRTVIERGKGKKEIASPLDSSLLALFISSLIQNVQMMSWRSGKLIDPETSINQIMTFVKHGAGVKEVKS